MTTLGKLILVLALASVSQLAEAAGTCTAVKLGRTEKRVAKFVKNSKAYKKDLWGWYRKSFAGDRDCMFVYEAYDFGEATRAIMMRHWDQISDLGKYKSQDPDFYQFALSALTDETASLKDIKAVKSLADGRCPKAAGALCGEISSTVEKFLKPN